MVSQFIINTVCKTVKNTRHGPKAHSQLRRRYHKIKEKVMQRQCRKANVLRRENKKSSISRPCQSGSDEMEEAKRKREEAAPNSIKSHLKEPSQLFPRTLWFGTEEG